MYTDHSVKSRNTLQFQDYINKITIRRMVCILERLFSNYIIQFMSSNSTKKRDRNLPHMFPIFLVNYITKFMCKKYQLSKLRLSIRNWRWMLKKCFSLTLLLDIPLYDIKIISVISLLDDEFSFFDDTFEHGIQHFLHLLLVERAEKQDVTDGFS